MKLTFLVRTIKIFPLALAYPLNFSDRVPEDPPKAPARLQNITPDNLYKLQSYVSCKVMPSPQNSKPTPPKIIPRSRARAAILLIPGANCKKLTRPLSSTR